VNPTQSKITAIVGAQWGDEGKGKITDFYAGESDYVVRFHGGNNAGHTVIVDNNVFKLHLIPSGVVYGEPISVIGNGVVVDPKALLNEILYLQDKGIDPKLLVSDRCHVIMPYHIELDSALSGHQAELAAGSTGASAAGEAEVTYIDASAEIAVGVRKWMDFVTSQAQVQPQLMLWMALWTLL